jgi:hypothetical protein
MIGWGGGADFMASAGCANGESREKAMRWVAAE